MILAFLMLANGVQAQKRKTTKKKKAKTTKVVKQQAVAPVVAVPLDSLLGKAYTGKVGQTVVDFFGTRNVYGDVTQQIYIWHDSTAVLRQINGTEEVYSVIPYSYNVSTLKIGQFTYIAAPDGASLQLQATKEKDEKREGKLVAENPQELLKGIYARGQYLNRMTEQTDEDKANARACLTMAAEADVDGAKAFLVDYYKKLADKDDREAIIYMMRYEASSGNYSAAHDYVDKLLDTDPDNVDLLNEKASLYDAAGKKSQAKKIRKKIKNTRK